MHFWEKSKKIQIAVALVVFVGLAGGTVAVLSLTKADNTSAPVSQESTETAMSTEETAYKMLESGEQQKALESFKKALSLSKNENRPEADIRSIETQIEFLEQDIKLKENAEAGTTGPPADAYTVVEGEDGIQYVYPAQ